MKVIAKKNRELALINAQNTQNENRAEIITLVVPEEYEDYNKKIVFITPNGNVWDVITNNEYKITNAITKYKDVDFYIWLTKEVDGESIDFRTRTKTLNFYHNEDASDEITDEEIHGVNTVVNILEEEIDKVENLNLEAEKVGTVTTLTITKKDGTTQEVEILDGAKGDKGDAPIRGVDYWTEEDKQEIIDESTVLINGKIEEYNDNATEKLNQYNQNSAQKTNDYNTNAEQKMSAYNTNASQKVESFNTNANSKLSEYNSNAETKKTAYDENATQKTTAYNTNSTQKTNDFNQNATQKTNDFNQNATQKTNDFDSHTEEIQEEIEALQTENARLKATLPTTTGTGQTITLNKTAEMEFKKPPLPMGNSEQPRILPRGYTELNYIESSGTQYIDTGYIPIQEDIIEIKNTSIASEGTLFSAGTGDYQLILLFTANDNNDAFFRFFSNNAIGFSNSFITNTDVKVQDGGIFYNNVLKRTSNYQGAVNTTLQIFRRANNSSYATAKVGEIIIRNNNNIKKHYIPCINSNNQIGMYDLVSNTFYGNAGTGTFIAGNAVILPNPSYPQEIINVTGDVEVVVQNKNLFNITSIFPISKNGLTFTKNDDGTITINGTASTTFSQSFTLLNQLLSGNYVIKHNVIRGSVSTNCYMSIQDSNNNNVSDRNYGGTGSSSLSLENKTIVSASLYITSRTVFNNYTVGSQLEQGTTASTYTPHKEQVKTFPLGTQRMYLGDYLADDGIHHVRGQDVFDGSNDENWNYEGLSYGNNFYINISNAKGEDEIPILSNYFKYYEHGRLEPDYSCKISRFKNLNLRHQDFTNTSDFKTWLSTHNVTVEYELAEEVIVPYTSAQQEVYNQIKQAISYEEQTNISSNQNALFSVEAYQSTKLVLQERDAKYESLEARVALLE